MAEAFILGLSTGSACLVTCGMVMLPYFVADSAGIRKAGSGLLLFLATRLFAYLLLSTVAWFFGRAFFVTSFMSRIIPGALYMIFAVMLVVYSIDRGRKTSCPAGLSAAIKKKRLVPLMLGLVNSIGFCPALFILVTRSATQGTLAGNYLAFTAFFAGSSIWFLPLPLAGKLKGKEVIRTVGILATGLAGVIFMIKGITNIIGGITNIIGGIINV
ncbi:MAG TPA: sulfite exporter TauE/SafE family protein [Bacteroidales bacterium]|nr:sulfite exporter TauE/SafE family protein [Bacteroidales bacterium]